MIRYLLALCLSLSLIAPSYAGVVIQTAGPSIQLPLRPNIPSFGNYEYGTEPGMGIGTYFFSMHLDANESYRIETPLCGGACTIWLSSYSGPNTITNSNLLQYQDVAGAYSIVFRIPYDQMLQLLVIHEVVVDGVSTPSILIMRIWNPDPNPPSSTAAPVIDWPGGRGPVGFWVRDNLSSAFLPRQYGWRWTESDQDISSYTLTIGFLYHLMEYDAFWIEPTFGTATYLSTTLNNSAVTGNYFGSRESPIRDSTDTSYRYHFNLPVGAVIDIKLYYVYQVPGQDRYEHYFNIVVENSFGLDPNAITNHAAATRNQILEIASPESVPSTEASKSATGVPTQETPVTIEKVPAGTNGASSNMLSAFTVALCALVAFMSL